MATLKEKIDKEREKIKKEIKNLKLEETERESFLNGILAGLDMAEKFEYAK